MPFLERNGSNDIFNYKLLSDQVNRKFYSMYVSSIVQQISLISRSTDHITEVSTKYLDLVPERKKTKRNW